MSLSFPPADTFDLNLFFPLQNSVSDPRSCLNVTGAFWALYIFGKQFVFGGLCSLLGADALLSNSSSSSLFLSFNNCFLENKVLSANRLLWIKPLWKVFPNLRTSMHVMRCYWKVYIIIKQYSEYGEKRPCVLFYSAGDDISTSTYEVVCLVQPFLI